MADGTETGNAARGRTWFVAALPALAVLIVLALVFRFTCDDAFISFRYARHLAEGHGLRFNLDEAPPVEGYSNFLWTLVLAVFEWCGRSPLVVADVLSIASAVVLVALVARFAARRVRLSTAGVATVALFLALSAPLVVWSTSGLETMAFALVLFATYERLALDPLHPRGLQAGACALAAGLLRADGAAWALVVLAAAAIDVGFEGERRKAFKNAVVVLVVGVVAHALWRRAYHGDWIPNTAHVKAGWSAMRLERGLKYALSMLFALPAIALAPALALALTHGRERRTALAAGLVLAVALGYSVWAGGDFMPFGRFLVPAVPFAAVALSVLVARYAGLARALIVVVLVALAPLALCGVQLAPASVRQALHFRWNEPEAERELDMWRGMKQRAEQWSLVGRALALHAQPDDSIILGGIGAIGYFSDLSVYDLFGLVSPEVARADAPLVRRSPGHDRAVEPEFFFDRHPTYLAAWIASRDSAPFAGTPRAWTDLAAAGRVHLATFTLDPMAGFPAGTELRVLRFAWER